MKELLLITSLMTVMLLPAKSQNAGEQKGGRIEALKIAYLTKKLDLSPLEAQKFWPIYNNYTAEIKNARMDQRQNKTPELETEDKILAIRKKYSNEFTHAISGDKIETFFRSEKDFADYVRKELQERRQLRQNNQNQQPVPGN